MAANKTEESMRGNQDEEVQVVWAHPPNEDITKQSLQWNPQGQKTKG